MRLEPHHFWTYSEWLFTQGALFNGIIVALALFVFMFILGYIVSFGKAGPAEAFYRVAKTIWDLVLVDLPATSMRRVVAIASLAFKEALRRRVLALVGLFVVGIMFAGWFLDPKSDEPAKLYISFVLQSTTILVWILALFLSCFSLPAEIKSRIIYTITTKPVRATEIFVGKVLGFAAVGTMILTIFGVLSFVFVTRGIRHTHEMATMSQDGKNGETTLDAEHLHTFEIGANGVGVTEEAKGHRHSVVKTMENGVEKYTFGPPVGSLKARVPIYGSLRYLKADGSEFVDAKGNKRGRNVGYESSYLGWIEGNTLDSAVWIFKGVTPSNFKDGLNIEMTLSAFRTYKGDIEKGVQGVVILRNPDGSAESERSQFTVKEFKTDQQAFSTKLNGFKNGKSSEVDLFNDLAPNGELEVVIRCLDRNQYMGMAGADLYLLAGEQPFWLNFAKGYVGIWLQMLIVIFFGVMFSTFLSGPVAMLATFACLILGIFGSMAGDIFVKKTEGGGPIESMVKMMTQASLMTELDVGSETMKNVIITVDNFLVRVIMTMTSVMPDFRMLGTADFVAYGVNIFGALLGRHLTITLGYFFLTAIIGYFFLKTREMAA